MSKYVKATIIIGLLIWPGIPLARFYGPYVFVYIVNALQGTN